MYKLQVLILQYINITVVLCLNNDLPFKMYLQVFICLGTYFETCGLVFMALSHALSQSMSFGKGCLNSSV